MGIGAELIPQCFSPVLYRVSENRIASGAGQHVVRPYLAERLIISYQPSMPSRFLMISTELAGRLSSRSST